MAVRSVRKLESLPVVVTLDEVCAIYRRGNSTIRRLLQNGTFRPAPFARDPYRWLRADIEEDLKRLSATAQTRAYHAEKKPPAARKRGRPAAAAR